MLISVVIPTFRRPDSLAACLECLEKQTLPREKYEVIVTDDDTGMQSREVMEEKFPKVEWTQGPGRGPAANRNHGASLAKGDWVAFVDDDCLPGIGWLNAIVSQSDVDVIEGKTVCPGARDTPFEEHQENLRGGAYLACNLAVRRALFKQLGGFDEDFREAAGEGEEFAWRIARDNLHTRFLTSALVTSPPHKIGWNRIWERTWLIRWAVLYRLKTGQSAPLQASWLAVVVAAVKREVARLLRGSLRLIVEFDPKAWRGKLFHQAWDWITFPLVLPYVVVWEFRFRKLLRKVRERK